MTTAGKAALAGLTNGVGGVAAFTYIGYGTDATGFAVGQTALLAQSQRAAATCSVSGATAQWVHTFTCALATETITEVGIFNAATNGTMLARSTTNKGLTLGDTYTPTYKITNA